LATTGPTKILCRSNHRRQIQALKSPQASSVGRFFFILFSCDPIHFSVIISPLYTTQMGSENFILDWLLPITLGIFFGENYEIE
jgi:hypothetical protein